MENDSKLVIPGDILLPADEMTRPGMGTYELHGNLYASLIGFLFIRKEIMNDKEIQVVEVRRSEEKQEHVIPYVGGIVTARVLNIGHKFAKCELLCVEDSPLANEYSANLRREDIRSTERDKIDLPKCVQPGDIIIARVISFGDNQSSFLLSTAEDQLGVVSAFSENDEKLIIVDWNTMKDPATVAAINPMNPTLNHINYLTAPVSFFGNQNSAAHTGYPQFPHSRSYPSFQDVPSANDQSDYVDHSATRVGTPSGLSPGTNNWESYDQERPQTPSFVGSGERRVKDIHHYEMVSLMKDKLTDVDTSTNTRLQSFLSEMSTCVLYDPPEEFTHRPKSTHLRTFPSKPSTDLDECIIRKNQAIYMASTSDAVSNAAIVNKTKRITNGSPTLQLKRGLVPFDKRMKWTRTVVNSTAENHVTSDDPGSSIDVNSAILNKKSKICSSLNYVPPPGASVIQGMAVSKNAVFVTADAIQTVTELRKHSPREIVCKIQSANGNQHKPYTLPLRNQLSLRNINGKTYQKDSRECFAFASGNCTAGIFCHFYHNGSTAHSEKVVCSRLLKGLCRPDNESCPLDHGLLEHQYPICSFYLREDCSESEKCKLLHVKHAPATPPCMEFNKGICFKGIECEQPHRYRYNVIKSMGCYNESTLEKDSSPSVTEESKLTGRRRYFPQVIERKSVMVETSGSNMVTDVADDLDVEEHVVGHIEEVEDQIIADDKCVDVVDTGDEDLLRHQDSRWGVVGNKRNYTEMDHEDDLDEEMDPHYMQSQQQFRRTMDAARKRGRPRKFPAGMMPPEFLQRVQQKSIDPQIHDGEYEDEIVPQTSQANPIPRTIHNHGGRMVNPRGGTTMSGNAPRLQQPVLVPRGSSVGQASHIASQRLPSISGGPPKENKPLKVVTLLPTSRRVAGAASRPVVSGIRTLGHPNRPSRTPQLPIEKQQIINQSVKYADRIISSQTIGDFNKCIEQQNSQIANLHEDNRKLHAMYTGLLEFKENRIKQLEVQVERLTAEYTAATKNWQAQLLLVENLTKSDGPKEDEGSNSPEAENQSDQQEVSHPRAQRAWVIEERIVRHNANGEMTEEIIEQEVDEETFLRMQQEIDENGETLMMEPMHSHEEEVVDEPTVNNDHALD